MSWMIRCVRPEVCKDLVRAVIFSLYDAARSEDES